MTEPIFWLVCSLLLVVVCLTAVLMTAIPAFRELGRASRSAERLFDTLYRELPPTLEAIRLTGRELTDLAEDISDGVESAGSVVQQVDQGLRGMQRQTKEAGLTTRSVWAGAQAALKSLMRPSSRHSRSSHRHEKLQKASENYHAAWIGGDRPSTDPQRRNPSASRVSRSRTELSDPQTRPSITNPNEPLSETFPDPPASSFEG